MSLMQSRKTGSKGNNRLTVYKEIFSSSTIYSAIEAYNGLCNILVCEKEKTTELTFNDCKYDAARTVNEFCNYIIELASIDI